MARLITIRTFDNYVTANIVKAKLEAEDVICFLKDENTITMQWQIAHAVGGIKLQVPEPDVQVALAILELVEIEADEASEAFCFSDHDEDEQLDPNNKVCIHCGSRNTRKDDYNKRPAALSWLLLGFPLFFKSDKWHCFHCGKKF